jgi:vitamin K-dependent gamma-carboxylase
MPSWATWLACPTANVTLAAFRIVFGVLIFAELLMEWTSRVEMLSTRPVRFPYVGFGWVPLVSPSVAVAVHVALAIACLCIAAGLWFRLAAVVFALGYTFSFFADRAYFNNHFYLICLLGGWLAVGDAHRRWSLDVLRSPRLLARTVPRWQLVGPAAQLAIPYVYGGLAKINPDWLRGEPMRAMLWELSDYPLYSAVATQPWAGLAFAWGGMLFDLLIVPALVWSRTRWAAVVAMVLFHVTNMNMLDIGIFPWLGIGSMVLFFPPAQAERLLARWLPARPGSDAGHSRQFPDTPAATSVSRVVSFCFAAWFAVQCVVPLRHYLIPGNVGWTREGFYFAWTMKRDIKSGFLGFHLCDAATGECRAVEHDRDLTFVQRYWLPGEPQGIVHYAKFLRERAIREGIREPVVVCDSVSALNGRPYQYMVDPALDPATLTPPLFGHATWIVPLDETARIGRYKIGAEKERAVMGVIEDARLRRGIFPERLRGKPVVDVTPRDHESE